MPRSRRGHARRHRRTSTRGLALAGAADVTARDEAPPEGFLVPHSTPRYRPDVIDPVSYGWCHGPAGDAQAFRLLRDVTADPGWADLADHCWHTVAHSGLPRRLRPGFWDSSGRCCGTAGVLALACDRIAEQQDPHDFAHILVADLAARAIRDTGGARWSNFEHRPNPGDLEPCTGWAMGRRGHRPRTPALRTTEPRGRPPVRVRRAGPAPGRDAPARFRRRPRHGRRPGAVTHRPGAVTHRRVRGRSVSSPSGPSPVRPPCAGATTRCPIPPPTLRWGHGGDQRPKSESAGPDQCGRGAGPGRPLPAVRGGRLGRPA
ncbi:lanthionine synthetase LanC family protein [Streptomyces sp. NPDC003720]|uniref:lanthionine synthetase LanC family protein n=1 Tax=Streptomyces sp. NPDC003720 TaxID=3364684 RepID=UPI0036BA0D71